MFDTMKMNTKWLMMLLVVLLFTIGFVSKSAAQDKFEKAGFYEVMASGNISVVDNEIIVVQNSASKNKEGYEGALLLKKADLVKLATKKLKYFKAGRMKLETALLNDPDNIEFHFLRLAVEEHAPKIVKYHNDIAADKVNIQKNYKNSEPVIQHAILDYCKNSKVLHREEL